MRTVWAKRRRLSSADPNRGRVELSRRFGDTSWTRGKGPIALGPEMSIRDFLAAPRPTLSFEVFPPRTQQGRDSLWTTLARLAEAKPDFISVTYGASGSTRTISRDVIRRLAESHAITPLAHLTCVGAARAEVVEVVEEFLTEGVRDFLAIRGDPPAGDPYWRPHPDGLLYASQLVGVIREVAEVYGLPRDAVTVGVAAFPATHAWHESRDRGLGLLREKEEAGADFAITQIFYEPEQYLALAEDARAVGISLPIIPGIIPLVDPARAARVQELTGVKIPGSLLELVAAAEAEGADAARAAGVASAARLARAVLDGGAPGVHVYTFNRYQAPLELASALNLRG